MWVPLVSAAIGAIAGLAGGALGAWLTNRGHAGAERRGRLLDIYAETLAAGHAIELYLAQTTDNPVTRTPPEMRERATFALARAALVAPPDTHDAVDNWAGKLARFDVREEYEADDFWPNSDRWEAAIGLMRRDLGTDPR